MVGIRNSLDTFFLFYLSMIWYIVGLHFLPPPPFSFIAFYDDSYITSFHSLHPYDAGLQVQFHYGKKSSL